MHRIEVVRKFSFEACHYLRDYDGKCANMHGHSYHGEVGFLRMDCSIEDSMVLDFNTIKQILDNVINNTRYPEQRLDHANLNKHPKFISFSGNDNKTTAENIALYMVERINDGLWELGIGNEIKVSFLKLYETEGSYVKITCE